MTIRKTFPSRSYETFASENGSDAGATTPHSNATSDSQKTGSAAQEAQRLATQGSWGDNYINGTPLTNATPTVSTVDEQEDRYGDRTNPPDPPPMYTPTATSPVSPMRSSPVATRSEVDPVRHLSSTHPSLPNAEHDVAHDDDDPPIPGAYTASSPLLEQQTSYRPNDLGWCKTKHPRQRFRGACWFIFALALCLWLMLPILCSRDKADTRTPIPEKDPLNTAPIPTWPSPSRSYHRHETSSPITGTYQLYDLLDLATVSGSISVTVNPQAGDKPAVLRLSSTSGSIYVSMGETSWRWDRLPLSVSSNRTFETYISTASGAISGSILHGNGGRTDLRTRSASMTMEINALGVGKNDSVSRISTSTSGSGSQVIRVHSAGTIRAIEGSHTMQGSGSLDITYGPQWEGVVHAKVRGSGSVNIDGTDLEFQGGGKDVYAKRGKGDLKGVDVLGSGSGSIAFRC